MGGHISPAEGGFRLPPPGVQDGGGVKVERIRDIFNLLHVLGFLSQEGGRRVGIKEEEEDNDSAMTNVEPK
jgi:hypothetical protein